jgi:cell wall-associated NlpC family hydrolase
MRRNTLYSIAFLLAVAGCATLVPPPDAGGRQGAAPAAERSEALLQAVLALGDDYRYGGESPRTGFDCSGLVAHVFEQAWGIHLPHSVEAQSEVGTPVSLAQLQPGDLVFYDTRHRPYSHVGIYIGEGRFVHAPRSGAQVRIEELRSRYWASRFDGARRIQPPPER